MSCMAHRLPREQGYIKQFYLDKSLQCGNKYNMEKKPMPTPSELFEAALLEDTNLVGQIKRARETGKPMSANAFKAWLDNLR